MRFFITIGITLLLAGPAQAAGCNLARTVEDIIAQLSHKNPVVKFISPIGETSGNVLDDAAMATIEADGYFMLIQRTASAGCTGIDGIASPLENPVEWQTARRNVRAAAGLE